jgi:rare lipoprotein A (peptidoglycan hydrolase)
MLRVFSQIAAALVFTTALGAAPANSPPNPLQGTPGQTKQTKHAIKVRKPQVGKASWYGRLFQYKQTASGKLFDVFDVSVHCGAPQTTSRLLGQGYRPEE